MLDSRDGGGEGEFGGCCILFAVTPTVTTVWELLRDASPGGLRHAASAGTRTVNFGYLILGALDPFRIMERGPKGVSKFEILIKVFELSG